jgi:hypothetical protein
MNLQKVLAEIQTLNWRPALKRAHRPRKEMRKTWKAFEVKKTRGLPVFEVGVSAGTIFMDYKPFISATKFHAGGLGSVWELDLEAADKLILMLLTARRKLKEELENENNFRD